MLDEPEYIRTFPEPAQPTTNALLNDWRFQAYVMTMHSGNEPTGETYSHVEIDPTQKVKGKKTKNTVLFTFSIPTPADPPKAQPC
jgi:hypothetical protein